MNITDKQATSSSRPFLVPHSNTELHKNSFFFFVCTTTDWHHLSDDQVKAWGLQNNGSPPQAPSNSCVCTPLPLHLYLKLGPVMYKIENKISFDLDLNMVCHWT